MSINSEFYDYFREIVAIVEEQLPVVGFSHIRTAPDTFVGEIFFVNGIIFGSFFQNDFHSIPIAAAAEAIIQKLKESNLLNSVFSDDSKSEQEPVRNTKQRYYRLARNLAYDLCYRASTQADVSAKEALSALIDLKELSPEGKNLLETSLVSMFPESFPKDLTPKKKERFLEWVFSGVKDHS